MNRLNPDLKRLMRWSRQAPLRPAESNMPPGFAARILARRNLQSDETESLDFQPLVGWAAWASGLVIIGGLAIILTNTRLGIPLEWASGAQFAINQLAP